MSSTSGVTPYNAARSSQVEDREAIKNAGDAAKVKISVVGAQVGVAEGAAKAGLGTQANKDYLAPHNTAVGTKVLGETKCASAAAILSSIKSMEPATTPESPLVKGAYATLGFAVETIASVAGATAAVGARITALPVNLECPAPEKPAKK